MASNIVPFPRRCANENADDVPPFDPANPSHVHAWRTMYQLGKSELRWRLEEAKDHHGLTAVADLHGEER